MRPAEPLPATPAQPAGRPVEGPANGRRPQGPSESSGNWPRATRSGPRQFPPGSPTAQRSGQLGTGGRPVPPPAHNGSGNGHREPMAGPPPQQRSRRIPNIPNQLPGHNSMPPRTAPPTGRPAAPAGPAPKPTPGPAAPVWPDAPSRPTMAPVKAPPPRRPPGDDLDAVCLTTEMEAISEETQKKRRVDHTLARFSKVHDELRAEEREKKARRKRLLPWTSEDELDHLDEIVGLQTPPLPAEQPVPETNPAEETRLQRKKNRRKHRSALAGKAMAGTAAILVFLATGVAWGFKTWVNSNQQHVDALDQNSSAIMDRAAQNGDENFLLVGSDTREGASVEDGVGDAKAVPGARSDTIMIAHVPANRQRVVVVSFPRDLEVDRPECQRFDSSTGKYTDEQVAPASKVKINTAYQVGGPKCVTKMVQQLSGLQINHFVGIEFNGFKSMVDAVDGVTVCVERPLKDAELGVIVKEAGREITLTGDQALNFVRARKVQGDPTSDYGRIIRQQRFLSALLRKAMSSQVLLDPGKLTDFVQAFSKATFGDNIDVDQLMLLGRSLQGLEAGRVTFITVPTVGEANGRGNEVLRVNDTNALFKAIRDDAPLPGEEPAPADTKASPEPQRVDPKTIKIQMLNGGNKTPRIAGNTGNKLKEFGYTIVSTNNAPEPVDKTVIKYGKDKEAAARTLASSVPGAQLQEDPSAAGALILVIGPDFTGEVNAPNGAPAAEKPLDLPNLSTVNAGDVECA